MKAIVTKYHGATSTRPSRISATVEGGNRLTVNYSHELNSDEAHKLAAFMLCQKMEWSTDFVSGGLPNGDTCHVFVPDLISALSTLACAAHNKLENIGSTQGADLKQATEQARTLLHSFTFAGRP